MKYVVALVLALVLNACANLLMKTGMRSFGQEGGILKDGVFAALLAVLTNPVLMIGLTCFALNVFFYMFALQGLKISIAYPVMVGGGYLIIATTAYLFLSERLTLGQWAAVILVLGGVILIAVQTPAEAAS